jgi:Right handed beta helix region
MPFALSRSSLLKLEHLETRAVPATITDATDTDDYSSSLPSDWDGTNNLLSVREAFREVNQGAASAIDFAGPMTIQFASSLPRLTRRVTITGITDSGGRPGTVLNGGGTAINSGFDGIFLFAGGEVRNLVLQGFGQAALRAKGGSAVIENNYIGTDAAGLSAIPNDPYGIWLEASGSLVSGNVISGNGIDGIHIELEFVDVNLTRIVGNKIGVGSDGITPIPNGSPVFPVSGAGVYVGPRAGFTIIGGTTAADRNIISANGATGVRLDRAGHGTQILGNYIGVASDGTTGRGNGEDGVYIRGAASATVGGATPRERNIIAGNGRMGVFVVWDLVAGVHNGRIRVSGNFIGVNAVGGLGGNGEDGVRVGAFGQERLGRSFEATGNVISGNVMNGIQVLHQNDFVTQMKGNLIGTDPAGLAARPNGLAGVSIRNGANRVVLGGRSPTARNIISGNTGFGVQVEGQDVHDVRVQGNFIGTDGTGARALPNGAGGVRVIDTVRTLIGGSLPEARNLVSGNGGDGVSVSTSPEFIPFVQVAGNFIGTDVDGLVPIPNFGDGVDVTNGVRMRIGLPGAGNRIAYNAGDGVRISGGTGNTIRANRIYANDGLGIHLLNGGNAGIAAATVDSIRVGKTTISIAGTVANRPRSTITLELFANREADPSGAGEGEVVIGRVSVRISPTGHFKAIFTGIIPTGFRFLSLTATDVIRNTSEFSQSIEFV